MPTNDASKMLSAGRGRRAHATVPDAPMSPEPVATSTRQPVAQSYVKTSCFLTPAQRRWLNQVAAQAKLDGIDGISASDVVRLALARLHEEVAGGFDLTTALVARAHAEAEHFPGRKNRGLPKRPG